MTKRKSRHDFRILKRQANYWYLVDSRIIRRMICESMLSTKMEKLLQWTVALVNQTALRELCYFFSPKQAGLFANWYGVGGGGGGQNLPPL